MAKRRTNKANRTAKKQSRGATFFKYVAVAVVSVVACGAGYHLFQKFDKDEVDSRLLVAQDYERYALNDTTGLADTDDTSAISTGAFYKLEGLEIKFAEGDDYNEEMAIKYEVHFYDKDFEFLGVEEYTEDFSEDDMKEAKDIGAVYVKIEIRPLEDADNVVSALEKSGYVKNLTVSAEKAEVEEESEKETEKETETSSSSAE